MPATTSPPRRLIPFRAGAAQVGWVSPDLAQALTFRPRDFHFDGMASASPPGCAAPARAEALAAALPSLAAGGFLRIRGELFDMRETTTARCSARLTAAQSRPSA